MRKLSLIVSAYGRGGVGCGLFRTASGRILDPAQTNYEQYAFYSTFDVTALLQAGDNSVGVLLGDGWYDQGIVWGPGFGYGYGQPILTVQMELHYADGTRKMVCSDSSWEWTDSPLISSNIYAGEVYDARREKAFDEQRDTPTGWHQAVKASGVVPAPKAEKFTSTLPSFEEEKHFPNADL